MSSQNSKRARVPHSNPLPNSISPQIKPADARSDTSPRHFPEPGAVVCGNLPDDHGCPFLLLPLRPPHATPTSPCCCALDNPSDLLPSLSVFPLCARNRCLASLLLFFFSLQTSQLRHSPSPFLLTFIRRFLSHLLKQLPCHFQSEQSFLKEVNPEYSLEGLMLKLKLQSSGH